MMPACPGAPELLALERQARHTGSGLSAAELIGTWQLARVFPKGRSEAAAFSSAALRAVAAQLRLAVAPAAAPSSVGTAGDGSHAALMLTNQVRLGALVLAFRGEAWLVGRRPLLQFQFDRLELRWRERLLLERALPPAAPGRRPFFALIGAGRAGGSEWLAARGRGGGLALWQRQAEALSHRQDLRDP